MRWETNSSTSSVGAAPGVSPADSKYRPLSLSHSTKLLAFAGVCDPARLKGRDTQSSSSSGPPYKADHDSSIGQSCVPRALVTVKEGEFSDVYSVRESFKVQAPMLLAHVYQRRWEGVGEFGKLLDESVDLFVKIPVFSKGVPGRGRVLSLGSESHSSSLFNAYDVCS